MRGLTYLCCGAAAALLTLAAPAAAQTPLFATNDLLPMTLAAPIARFQASAPHNDTAYPATLTAGGQHFEIHIAPRGLTRRRTGVCSFPPIRLDFAQDTLRGTLFEGQNHLKLVTHCGTSAASEQYVVIEYLAYRLYNVLTPYSFRARASQVTYHDTERNRDSTHFGFMLEDIDDVARRNDRVHLAVQSGAIAPAQLDAQAAERFALFQYMISNQDWDFVFGPAGDSCCHNNRFIAHRGETANVVPVPYDFDYSGLVNAPYAVPPTSLHLANVTTRLFRGYCRFNDQLPATVEYFRAHRAEMMSIVANEPHLNDGSRRRVTSYLDGFFAILDDPARVQSQLASRCRSG